MEDSKSCLNCGTEFTRDISVQEKIWERRLFCIPACGKEYRKQERAEKETDKRVEPKTVVCGGCGARHRDNWTGWEVYDSANDRYGCSQRCLDLADGVVRDSEGLITDTLSAL